jgi:GT2 family glycosyltransferase
MKKMTIITPVFQTPDIFALFLATMTETLLIPVRIIFINDGSSNIINEMILDFRKKNNNTHEITLLKNQSSIGCSKSINKALKIVQPDCDIVVFIDSDTILNGNWQKEVIHSFNKPHIGIVGGILLYPQTSGIQCCGISFNNAVGRHIYLNARLKDLKLDYEFEVQATVFAFCAIRYNAIKQVGLLDEQFYNGYEDWDYQFRIRKYEYKAIINTNIVHFHWENSNGLHRSFNRKNNLGRFWSKHSEAVSNDFWMFFLKQFNKKFNGHGKQYIGIDLCKSRNEADQFWSQIKIQTNIELVGIYNHANLCDAQIIWLPQILDSGSVSNNKSFLFLCDNFVQLLDNDYWYRLRQKYCVSDIIVDLYGNSIFFNKLKNSFWPGTKIR